MTGLRRHNALIRIFFLLVFAAHFGSVTLCTHSHVVNGVVVVHSHFHHGAHSHSAQEIETIYYLSKVVNFGDPESPVGPALILCLIGIFLIPELKDAIRTPGYGTNSLRAPPVLI